MSPVDHGLQNYRHPDRFGIWLGYELVSLDREAFSAECRLAIREDHLSPAGRVHGGVLSAFMDYASGAAVFSTLDPESGYCSTVELKINYLRPVNLGDRLIARTQVVFLGKRLCVIQGTILRDQEKEPIAITTATFNVGKK